MKKAIAIFGLALMLAVAAVAQQESPRLTAPPNSVFAGADGKYEAAPDTALMQFEIAAQEGSAKAAQERASRAAEQIRQMLRANGIDPKQAEIGSFSLAPVYDYRTPKRKLLGYRVTSAVTLKLKDFTKIGPIVQQLADLDVTSNQSLNYILDNMDAAKIQAVEDAFRRARAEAEAVARAGGRTLGELYYSSVDVNEPVRPVMAMRTMAVAGANAPAPTEEFTPQKITVTARVNAMFLLK